MTDQQLLTHFAATRDQSAFAELVARHVHWVNAMAQRMVHDPSLAADVTQAVFILLARKAAGIHSQIVISGWLFTVTRFSSIKALREQRRRREHERKAAMMRQQLSISGPETERSCESLWEQLRPLLDESVARLRSADRQAVVLRFYRQMSFGQIGDELQISEDAARKRVSRAIERLRAQFARKGIAVGSATLIGALGMGLPHTASAAVVSGAGAASAGAAAPTFMKGIAATMAWGAVTPLAMAVASLIVVSALTLVVMQLATPTAVPAQAVAPASAPAAAPASDGAQSNVFYGRLVTEDDQPVPGARTAALWFDTISRQTRTLTTVASDVDGRFEVPRGPLGTNVLIEADGFGISAGNFPDLTWADAPAEFVLEQPATARLRLIGPDDKPAAGVHIALSTFKGHSYGTIPVELQSRFTQTTNESGECVFTAMPREGELRFEILDDRFAELSYQDRVILTDAADVTAPPIKLLAACEISGRATYASSGAPVANLKVVLTGPSTFREFVTGPDGQYNFKRLRPDEYFMIMQPEPQISAHFAAAALQNVKLLPAQHLAGQDLKLIEGAVVRGRITNQATGQPLEGVGVIVMGPQNPDQSSTALDLKSNADGEFLAHVPPGKQTVQFRSPTPLGMREPDPFDFDLDLADGATGTANFAVPVDPTPALKGRVADQDGTPVAGALISVTRRNEDFAENHSPTSDAQGNFMIPAFEPGSALRARRGRMATVTPLTVDSPQQPVTLVVHRDAIATARVTVQDASGAPLAGAHVELISGGGMVAGVRRTNSAGVAVLKPLYPDLKYEIWVSSSEYATERTKLRVTPGEQIEVGPVRLARADSHLAGQVVDAQGNPLAGITVSCVDEIRSFYTSTRTDADGHFRFDHVVPGQMRRVFIEQDRKRIGENQQLTAPTDSALLVMPTTRP
jgi:RNA polymerase sigma factor (sigma-70 family)